MIGSSTVRRAEGGGELEADVGGLAGRVPLRKAQAQHVVGAQGPDADPGDDAGVHPAGDGDHGPAAAELADRVGRPLGEPVEAGGAGRTSRRVHLSWLQSSLPVQDRIRGNAWRSSGSDAAWR